MRTIEKTKRTIQNLKAAGLSYDQCYRVLYVLAFNMRFARYWGVHRNRAEYYFDGNLSSGTKHFTSRVAFVRWYRRFYQINPPKGRFDSLAVSYDDDNNPFYTYFLLQEECE